MVLLTSCKKLEKTNEQSPRYLKTDGLTDGQTDGQGRLLWTQTGKPGIQNEQKQFFWPIPLTNGVGKVKNSFKKIA